MRKVRCEDREVMESDEAKGAQVVDVVRNRINMRGVTESSPVQSVGSVDQTPMNIPLV